jgi:hypothetical protein
MSAQAVAAVTPLIVYDQARKSHALPELNDPRVAGQLHCVYLFNCDVLRRVRWAGDVAYMEGTRNVYEMLVEKPE